MNFSNFCRYLFDYYVFVLFYFGKKKICCFWNRDKKLKDSFENFKRPRTKVNPKEKNQATAQSWSFIFRLSSLLQGCNNGTCSIIFSFRYPFSSHSIPFPFGSVLTLVVPFFTTFFFVHNSVLPKFLVFFCLFNFPPHWYFVHCLVCFWVYIFHFVLSS